MDPTLKAVLASWQWRPDVALVVAGLAAVYVTGWCRLRRRKPKAVRPWRLALYLCGLAAIILALLSPLDTFAPWLFTLHMVEHQLLTMVAPPLLLLANPLPVVLWALPRSPRHALGRLLARGALVRRGFRRLTWMPVTWVLYMVILWSWHLPGPYQAALQDDVLHNGQHLSFFASALLFWWPLINPAPRLHGHIPYGFRIVYVIAAVVPVSLPTMSIALFARQAFYPHYETVPRLWGLTALQDQITGWVLMGTVDGLIYMIAFLLLFARMLDYEERVTRLRETIDAKPGGT